MLVNDIMKYLKMLMMVVSGSFLFDTLRNFLNRYYLFLQDAQSLVEGDRCIKRCWEGLQVCDGVCRVQRVHSDKFYGKRWGIKEGFTQRYVWDKSSKQSRSRWAASEGRALQMERTAHIKTWLFQGNQKCSRIHSLTTGIHTWGGLLLQDFEKSSLPHENVSKFSCHGT